MKARCGLLLVLLLHLPVALAQKPGGPVELIVVAGPSGLPAGDPAGLPEDPADQEVLFWRGRGDPSAGASGPSAGTWTRLRGQVAGDVGLEIGLARTILASQDAPPGGTKRLAIVQVRPNRAAAPAAEQAVPVGDDLRELVSQTRAAVDAARAADLNVRLSALVWRNGGDDVTEAETMAAALRGALEAPQMAVLCGLPSSSGTTAARALAARDRRFIGVDISAVALRGGAAAQVESGRRFALAWLNLKSRTGPWWSPTEPADPIAGLQTGQSATRLATPVALPFARVLPGAIEDWVLLLARGDDNREYLLETRPLTAAGFHYAQHAGRGASGLKPWWLLANRRTGQGLGLTLAYMGNWKFDVSPQGPDQIEVRLATLPGGLEPFATIQGLPVPGALVSEFTGHWDYGAQPITRFIRERLLRDMGPQWPPVEYNCWYGSGKGNYSQEQLLAEAKLAAELGFEVFVIDAGWYGEGPGRAWGRNLGDWRVNRTVFPDGMEPLSREVRRLGMKFGVWFEIECVNPRLPLAQQNPDWILKGPDGLPLSTKPGARVVLDLSRPDVLRHVEKVLDDTIGRHQLDYLKLDFNTHPVIDNGKLDQATDPLYRHHAGLARLLTRLRDRHPSVVIENCASGSMRQELSAAALTDTHWISDDTRNQTNLLMSFGANWLFPPATCLHWTVQPTRGNPLIDLEAQFVINMMGHFGVSSRLQDWDAETVAIFKQRVAQYKRHRSLIREADVFHLTPQRLGVTQAALYVEAKGGRALLFAFQGGADDLQTSIRLRGLDPNRRYRTGGDVGERIARGRDLVGQGLELSFPGPGAALVITLDPLPD